MQLDNGIDIVVHKSFYQKTKVQKDGVTHIVDTDHSYPLYELRIAKNYFNIDQNGQVADQVIKDLKEVIQVLEKLKHNKQQNKQYNELLR